MRFDAKGWYCAVAVIQFGHRDARSVREGGCAYSSRYCKRFCTGIRKIPGTRKIEIEIHDISRYLEKNTDFTCLGSDKWPHEGILAH